MSIERKTLIEALGLHSDVDDATVVKVLCKSMSEVIRVNGEVPRSPTQTIDGWLVSALGLYLQGQEVDITSTMEFRSREKEGDLRRRFAESVSPLACFLRELPLHVIANKVRLERGRNIYHKCMNLWAERGHGSEPTEERTLIWQRIVKEVEESTP